MYRSNRSFDIPPPPPGQTPGIWQLWRPGEEGIWLSESSRGWGIWSPCVRSREFELHPRFHVKSLAWRAIMGDAVLGDFRGKDIFLPLWPIRYEEWAWTSFVPCWRYLNFNIFNIGFSFWIYECIKVVFTMKYNTYYRRFNATIKSSTEVKYFDLPHV